MAALESVAIQIHRHGGPEVLVSASVSVPDPGPGELRIRQSAIGLNFADIYQRKGAAGPHKTEHFPEIPGSQGAGIVESVGPGVSGFAPGDSIAYVHPGAYCSVRLVPAERAVPLPAVLTLETAAATLLRGMTAEYLLHRLYPVRAGDTILVHAAAGGMGQILSSWAKALGATVIGTVGTPAKVALARAAGCDHVIDYSADNFVEAVASITAGQGVEVVYDAVGRSVFMDSLQCLKPRGMAINYGTASGDVEGLALQTLHAKSLIVTRPTLRSYIATREDLLASAACFADAVGRGWVSADISHRYALAEVQQAHRDLEGRRTAGATILIP